MSLSVSKLVKTKEGLVGTLIYSALVRSQVTTWTCDWHLGAGAVLLDLTPPAVDSVTMELNRRTPAGVGVRDLLAAVGRPPATHTHTSELDAET